MKKELSICSIFLCIAILSWIGCKQKDATKNKTAAAGVSVTNNYGGFKSEKDWGKHLVSIGGCNDCHSPKIMTSMGPVPDTSLMLSGHPSNMPAADVNRGMIAANGLVVTNDLTSWVGPWGVSFAANLTPDSTGIGTWKESQFITAIRKGKYMGIEGSRQLLPPMPWQGLSVMTDGELKAIFTYLKSIKPVHNIVPLPLPPVTGKGQ